jgi:hypothetical protein
MINGPDCLVWASQFGASVATMLAASSIARPTSTSPDEGLSAFDAALEADYDAS